MNFNEAWIEHDYNPFICFNENGRVKSLNQEAQYLLGAVSIKKIFDIAKTYANITYGFKTTIIDLSFGSYLFYGITVGYQDDTQICIRLYKKPSKNLSPSLEDREFINIYSLLDLCISATSASSIDTKHQKIFDPTFPDVKLKVEEFIKLVNKIYQSYIASDVITSKLMLNTGEYLRFQGKKYPIFSLHVEGKNRNESFEKSIEDIAIKAHTIVEFNEEKTTIISIMISS